LRGRALAGIKGHHLHYQVNEQVHLFFLLQFLAEFFDGVPKAFRIFHHNVAIDRAVNRRDDLLTRQFFENAQENGLSQSENIRLLFIEQFDTTHFFHALLMHLRTSVQQVTMAPSDALIQWFGVHVRLASAPEVAQYRDVYQTQE
jgi:hypothetical protein